MSEIDPRIDVEHLCGYARRMSADIPFVATTHSHKSGHWAIIEEGIALVNGLPYSAPSAVWIEPGEVHSIKSISKNVKWLCVHVFPIDSEEGKAIGVTMDEALVGD